MTSELEVAGQKAEKAEAEVAAADQRLIDVREAKVEQEQAHKKTRDSLAELQGEAELGKQRLTEAHAAVTAADTKLESLISERDRVQESLAQAEEDVSEREQRLKTLEERVVDLESDLKQTRDSEVNWSEGDDRNHRWTGAAIEST